VRTAGAAALCLLWVGCSLPENAAGPIALRFIVDPAHSHFGTLQVMGLGRRELSDLRSLGTSEEWEEVLAIYTGETLPPDGTLPAVLGEYVLEGSLLRFTPRFPFVPGQAYVARWRAPSGAPGEAEADFLTATFSLPRKPSQPTTVVTQLYPTADELPENVLKLYLHFSAAMSQGEADRYIHLLDAAGEELPYPFVAPHQELWNRAGNRLTLILDPGRIKRDVGPNMEVGPPLLQGASYRLVVDSTWEDAQGTPLAKSFEKAFRAVAPDRLSPNIEDWRLEAPTTTEAPLTLGFPEALDHALLHRLLRVFDPTGSPVEGDIQIDRREQRWTFTPTSPWRPGLHELRIATTLEDLAGNTLSRLFDAEMTPSKTLPEVEKGFASLHFSPPSQP